MPTLTPVLFRLKAGSVKKFNNYKYTPTYRIVLPPILRDFVSSKGDLSKSAPCLQEVSVMLTCWKKNDFVQHLCSKEIQDFQKCITEAEAVAKRAKEALRKGESVEGSGRLPSRQVNKLLQRYPQPRTPIVITGCKKLP